MKCEHREMLKFHRATYRATERKIVQRVKLIYYVRKAIHRQL